MPSTINASASSGLVSTADTSTILALQTNGTTAVTIDASQNVGIGTTTPAGLLQLNSDAGTGEATNRGNLILVNQTGTGAGSTKGIEFKGSASGSGYGVKLYLNNDSDYFGIATRFSSATWTERLKISESNGNVTLTNNLGIGNTTPTTSGTGITFPATQSASSDANTLDDYEEGTFTISAIPSTSGSITLYAGSNPASYTKIGRMVTVSGFVYVQSVSSPVGILRITGLPFAIRNQDPSGRGAGSVAGIGLASGATTSLQLRFAMNETELRIEKFAAGTFSNLAGDVQTGSEIYFSATYPAAT
jgi:hypothetical protein